MNSLKYLAVFALGAACAAIAISQAYTFVGDPTPLVAGTDRKPGTDQPRAFSFYTMNLNGYGGTNSGYTGPWNTASVGPVLEVRKRLTDLQQESLRKHRSDRQQPLLVRFEIIEAWIDTLHSSSSIEVPVRTILYWAESRPGAHERFDVVKHVIRKSGESERHSKVGGALSRVTIETRDYFITSPKTGDHEFGADGWKIAREKEISKNIRVVRDSNEAVAFYDTTLLVPH